MKKLFVAAAVFASVMLSARFAPAQVYVPGYPYYAPYGYAAPYAEPQYYDPYAELHALHYQLYLPYPYAYPYYGYYCCAPVVTAPPRVINPAPRPAGPPAARK